MSTSGCKEFLTQLEAWMEGERPSRAEEHVRGCASCRGLVDELDAIRQSAHVTMGAEIDPPAHVWTPLRVQLEQEGLIHHGHSGWTEKVRGWIGGAFDAVPRPALAGAYLVALIAVALAVTGPVKKHLNQNRWISGTQDSTGPLSARLDTAMHDSISSYANSDPVVTASLHDNLAIVDNYIALCEKSVHEDPENEIARDYLYGAYEQKADLLAQMTERGDDGR